MAQRSSPLAFNVWDEDGLVFDSAPELFVRLDAEPTIVFTVRGLAYFSPRFKHIGVDIAEINTREDFEKAMDRWLDVERVLLKEKVEAAARATRAPNEHQVLNAVLHGDIAAAERALARLEHQSRAGLSIVRRPQ